MAKNVQLDPMKLDTAGAPILTGRTANLFKTVEWVNPVAVGDRAYLHDALGAVVCDFTCTTPSQNVMKDFGGVGAVFSAPFNISQLDSGYLLVARA